MYGPENNLEDFLEDFLFSRKGTMEITRFLLKHKENKGFWRGFESKKVTENESNPPEHKENKGFWQGSPMRFSL